MDKIVIVIAKKVVINVIIGTVINAILK